MSLKLHQALRNVCYRRREHFLGLFANASKNYCIVKPFEAIPRAPRIPIFGSLPYFIMGGGHSKMPEYADKLHKKLGPIFVDNIGGHEFIFIANAESNREMYLTEGEYPKHHIIESWKVALKDIGKDRGLFFMNDEDWLKTRKVFNPIMLRPDSMKNHVANVSAVCKDFMEIWKINRPSSNLKANLACWNIECFGEIVFGKRLGFMEKLKINKYSLKYKKEIELVNATGQVYNLSAKLHGLPMKTAKILKPFIWRKFRSAMSTVLEIGGDYVNDAVKECKAENPSEKIQECLVYKALMRKPNEESFTEVMIDIFLASPNTTSVASSWALYLLGRHPEIQAKARMEIFSLLEQNKDETISFEMLSKLKYIDAIIHETLRMYSVAPFITRILPEEIKLHNYRIPAGSRLIASMNTMGRDSNNYTEPDQFRPERWIENSVNNENMEKPRIYKKHNRKAFTPFAFHNRRCIGQEVAELNMSLLLIEALKTFEWTVEEEIPMEMRLITVPTKSIILKLKSL